MSRGARLARWLVGRVVPSPSREPVVGDLEEEAAARERGAAGWILWTGFAIATRMHLETYRDRSACRGVLTLLACGLTILWIIPAATWPTPPADLYADSLSRAVALMWSASHIIAAGAAGLAAGHLPTLAPYAEHGRWHAVIALAAASAAVAGPESALVLLGAAWLGAAGRSGRPSTPTAAICGNRRGAA